MISVLFRVAGGARLGFGHLRRCWTLADRLRMSGAAVRFVTTSHDARAALARATLTVTVESAESSIAATMEAVRALAMPRLLVIDDPEISVDALASLRMLAPVACFDDNARRPLAVDLVVNGSAHAATLSYRCLPETRFLLGPRYIVLRDVFARVPARPAASAVLRRAVVLTGGADFGGMTSRLVRGVLETLGDVIADVVTGPFAPPPAVDSVEPSLRARLRLHPVPDDIASLMLDADFAVSGGGQTAYELAATGTPTIGIRLGSDQAMNLRGLAAAGCLRDIGAPDDQGFDTRFTAALAALAADPAGRMEMSCRGRALVDGRGANRVAEGMARLAEALVS